VSLTQLRREAERQPWYQRQARHETYGDFRTSAGRPFAPIFKSRDQRRNSRDAWRWNGITQGASAFDTVDGSFTGARRPWTRAPVRSSRSKACGNTGRSIHGLGDGSSAISESQELRCSHLAIREMPAEGVPAAL